MNRFALLSSALLAVSITSSSVVIAQTQPAPVETPAALQGMQNVQAIQQQTSTGQPPTVVAAPDTQAPAPAVSSAPVFTSPVQPVAASSPAELSDDDLMRNLARLQARKAMVEAEGSLETAELNRQKNRLAGQAALTKAGAEAARIQEDPFGEKAKARDEAAKLATVRASSPAGVARGGVAYGGPPTLVRSIYGYGDQAYAEMVIGYDKVLATPGTVLTTGERVVSIGSGGVVVIKNGKRRTLPVSGSASTSSAILPVSQTTTAPGLPSMPPSPPIN